VATDRLSQQSRDFMAGDRTLRSSDAVPAAWLDKARATGNASQTINSEGERHSRQNQRQIIVPPTIYRHAAAGD
jgi:predicted lysophospholipase L1 biosynthesis ABC-type transport system permease subunit